jgi:regulator of sigma E protease
LLTAIVFIIVLAVLIFVHELGHFLVAKKFGIKVEEFGFGFPPRIWGIKKGETVYSVNWIPFGGFVKIFGEDGGDRNDKHSFVSKKIWQRASVLLAGASMNVVLAVLLLSLGFMIGLPWAVEDNENIAGAKVQITQIAAGSPAELAGIKTGDIVLGASSQGEKLSSLDKVIEFQNFIDRNKGEEVLVDLKRGQRVLTFKLTPRANPPTGEGAMGVGLARVSRITFPWYRAIWEGLLTAFDLIWLTLSSLGLLIWQLFSHGRVAGEVTGPVGIYSITGQAAQMGFVYILQLAALLSINLAVINVFPFPALDGGRVLFLMIEKIKGSPVSERVERAIHSAGFIFLILLMVVVAFKDIVNLF